MSDFKKLMELPSKYLVYPGITPGDIQVRSLTGEDEEVMAEVNTVNIELKFIQLLDRVIQGVKAKDLTLGDRMYILLWLSNDTYGNLWPIDFYCEHCFQKTFHEVDLLSFMNSEGVKFLEDGFKQPVTVQLSDRTVDLRLFTVGDEAIVSQYEAAGNNGYLYKYALSMVDEKSVSEKYEMLKKMSSKDLNVIKSFHLEHEHGPIMVSPYVCRNCGGEGRVAVPFRTEMVFRSGEVNPNSAGKRI
jgi:hypothetical protein